MQEHKTEVRETEELLALLEMEHLRTKLELKRLEAENRPLLEKREALWKREAVHRYLLAAVTVLGTALAAVLYFAATMAIAGAVMLTVITTATVLAFRLYRLNTEGKAISKKLMAVVNASIEVDAVQRLISRCSRQQ